MTVNTTTNRVSYAGNGTTTAFAVPFPFLADADLVVIERTDSTGAEVTKTLTTHYTVSGAGGVSGTVTMVTAPATGVTLIIYRDPAVTQLVDLVPNDPLPVETAVEQPLDRLTMIAQRNRDLVERALRLPDSDTGFAASDMKIPAKVTRASKYLAFDADGKPMAADPTGALSAVSPFMATVLDDADEVAAAATLKLSDTADPARGVALVGRAVSTDTAQTISGDKTFTGNNTHTVTPAADGAPIQVFTSGSTAVSGTNEGLRRAAWSFFDTKTDDTDTVSIMIDIRQTSNPGGGSIGKTGIHVKSFTMPDNGGDVSGGLFVQTGGGCGLAVYKRTDLRPTGFTDYTTGGFVAALEVGTNTDGVAIKAICGHPTAINNFGQAVFAAVNGTNAKGILVEPTNGVFDGRVAIQIGTFVQGAANSNTRYAVYMNGDVACGGANAASAGGIRLPNNISINARNSTNTADASLIYFNASDQVVIGGGQDIKWSRDLVALGGGAAPTFGTIGGSGPATAAQNSWMRVIDSTGAAFWVPVWK